MALLHFLRNVSHVVSLRIHLRNVIHLFLTIKYIVHIHMSVLEKFEKLKIVFQICYLLNHSEIFLHIIIYEGCKSIIKNNHLLIKIIIFIGHKIKNRMF